MNITCELVMMMTEIGQMMTIALLVVLWNISHVSTG